MRVVVSLHSSRKVYPALGANSPAIGTHKLFFTFTANFFTTQEFERWMCHKEIHAREEKQPPAYYGMCLQSLHRVCQYFKLTSKIQVYPLALHVSG